jgi:hypothetical protein
MKKNKPITIEDLKKVVDAIRQDDNKPLYLTDKQKMLIERLKPNK